MQYDLYQKLLKEKRTNAVLSKPLRPPRPYDYSKEKRYTSGMLYIPKTMMVSNCYNEKFGQGPTRGRPSP